MTTSNSRQGLVTKGPLTEDELREVLALAARCDALEGLSLKLNRNSVEASARHDARTFLYYDMDQLVGCATLDGEIEIEICGMVHPEHRRRGIGRALLMAVIAECRPHHPREVLLLCEEASASGKGFVATLPASILFGEHRMELHGSVNRRPGLEHLVVRPVEASDTTAVARVLATAFESSEQEASLNLAEDIADPSQRLYVALVDGVAVGSLRVYFAGDAAGIYAFGVLPERRGQGIGREMLARVVDELRATGTQRFWLEVRTDNPAAYGLYRSCGFTLTTTYNYYLLILSQLPTTASA